MSTIASHSPETVGDKDSVPKDHRPPIENGSWELNDHVIEDVTWPRKITICDPDTLRDQYLENSWRYSNNR